MPLPQLIDITKIDTRNVIYAKNEILKHNPQRYEFEQLDEILYLDIEEGIAVGRKKQRNDEFWVKGHIPGRPLMPGVLMIEMAAQICSFYYHKKIENSEQKFFGFGGVDKVKFRGSVAPGETLIMAVKSTSMRSRIAVFESQGFVNNKMVFEGTITGVII